MIKLLTQNWTLVKLRKNKFVSLYVFIRGYRTNNENKIYRIFTFGST